MTTSMNREERPTRTPATIGRDLRANFAELWEGVRERATRVFDKLDPKEILAVRHFDDLRRIVKHAYQYDDARVDEELDRFANEGGATPSGPATSHVRPDSSKA